MQPRSPDKNSTNIIFDLIKQESDKSLTRGRDAYERVAAPLDESANEAAGKALSAAAMALPVFTGFGLITILGGQGRGEMAGVMRAMAVPLTIGGFVLDLVKWPFCLIYATEKAAHAGIAKIASAIMEGSPQVEFEKHMLASFVVRLTQTAQLLCALNLEDAVVMENKLHNGDIDDLIGLTLLHTAFASRHCIMSTLRLANGKGLRREDCPPSGLALFDKCIEARDLIAAALGGQPQRICDDLYKQESAIVCRWIPFIRAGKFVEIKDVPEDDEKTVEQLNKLIALLAPLSAHAKALLPANVAEVGHKVPAFRK